MKLLSRNSHSASAPLRKYKILVHGRETPTLIVKKKKKSNVFLINSKTQIHLGLQVLPCSSTESLSFSKKMKKKEKQPWISSNQIKKGLNLMHKLLKVVATNEKKQMICPLS